MRRFFNKRILWLGWGLVAIFAGQLLLVVTHPERPTSRTVSIAPLAATDTAVQRQTVD